MKDYMNGWSPNTWQSAHLKEMQDILKECVAEKCQFDHCGYYVKGVERQDAYCEAIGNLLVVGLPEMKKDNQDAWESEFDKRCNIVRDMILQKNENFEED
jgi:hypothetical protein